MTRRRWIADSSTETTARLIGDQANHLFRVLRVEVGDQFDVVAGDRVWRASVVEADEASVEFALLEEIASSTALSITVLLSVFKFDRFEWAVEKLTELGVATIVPAIARRTEKHLGLAAVNRVERWRRIALEAAKQSRRSSVPAVEQARPLREALDRADGSTRRFLLAEAEKEKNLLPALQGSSSGQGEEIYLAVGPEGGWTAEEQDVFAEKGWTSVSLGETILRAETAAIAAASVIAAWMQG